jgi:small-conductance mechanosensitive channel
MEFDIASAAALGIPELWLQYGHYLLKISIVIVGGLLILKLVNAAIQAFEAKQKSPSQLTAIFRIGLRWLILAATVMVGLQQIGVNIASLWGVVSAVVAMVAIGFVAVWSVLSNLLCTVVLVLMHPFRIGDDVEIIDPAVSSGLRGKVRNINFIFTELSDVKENGDSDELFVPNNLFFQKVIRRHSGRNTYSLDAQLFNENSLLKNGNEAR